MVDREEIDVLLQKARPIEISEDSPSIWQRVGLHKREYVIELKPFPYGIFLKLQLEYSKITETKAKTVSGLAKSVIENQDIVDRILCLGFGGNPDTKSGERLITLIKDNLPNNEVYNCLLHIIKYSYPGNFTSATNSITQSLVAEKK